MIYLRFCSLQSGCFKASHNDFTPSSPISLPFRSRCIRFWLWVKEPEIPWQMSGKEVNLNLQKKKYTGEITSSSLSLITTSFSFQAQLLDTIYFYHLLSDTRFLIFQVKIIHSGFSMLPRKKTGLWLRCPLYPDNQFSQFFFQPWRKRRYNIRKAEEGFFFNSSVSGTMTKYYWGYSKYCITTLIHNINPLNKPTWVHS